jgi:hypothetical protein
MTDLCPKCDEAVPDGKLGMHYRAVHAPDLIIYNDPE